MKAIYCLVATTIFFLTGCASHHHARHIHRPAPENRTTYHEPLLSSGATFGALPPTVQNTIRAEVGGAEIDRVIKGIGAGHTVYVIFFQQGLIFPPLYVAPDGSVLNPNLTVAVAAPGAQASTGHLAGD
ncbi:MAG: hypothetical protein C5B50_27945 [Verrucomicrobia bacterium]|nr:MAG: hypothetical protein C5B50_27945 [Verrucomicrobiota bacterium]